MPTWAIADRRPPDLGRRLLTDVDMTAEKLYAEAYARVRSRALLNASPTVNLVSIHRAMAWSRVLDIIDRTE